MNDTKPDNGKKLSMPGKEDKRAAALRDNLKKRKAAMQQRKTKKSDAGPEDSQ